MPVEKRFPGPQAPMTMSAKAIKRKTSICNVLLVAAAKNCGVGYAKLVKFFLGLNIPKPLHVKTFQQLAIQIHRAAMAAASTCMAEAAAIVHNIYESP